MHAIKGATRMASLSLALLVLAMLFPALTSGYVSSEVANFGNVVVGSPSTVPLTITNEGNHTLALYFELESGACNFMYPSGVIILYQDKAVTVEITWTPPYSGSCSDILYVKDEGTTLAQVTLLGEGIESDKDPETIILGGCDTGVANLSYLGQQSLSASIDQCALSATKHGQFVSCVARLTNQLKQAGMITDTEKDTIQSCAARANIPKFGKNP
jgi:hypothetical protein